ncbi:unnamed protein product [Ophioblennius macclurei]
MMFFLFLLGLALCAATPVKEKSFQLQRSGCPLFWYSFKGRCYQYVASHMEWADAELHCVSQGGNLVSIHSVEEQNFVASLIKNFDPEEGVTWIGLSDLHKESRWMWSDGSRVNFVFWGSGQPDNLGNYEHCAEVNWLPANKWNDSRCSHTFPSVCALRTACP